MHYACVLVREEIKSSLPDLEASQKLTKLSIIVPLLNERRALPELTNHLKSIAPDQIIIVDGGSTDGGWQWLLSQWQDGQQRIALQTQSGRAHQMHAGAQMASGDLLLFLHADSQLPVDSKQQIERLSEGTYHWGRFNIGFASNNSFMPVIAWFMNHRSCLTGIATGDQGIFLTRSAYDKVDGFDALPLMEDVALCKKLKSLSRPLCVDSVLRTSARRWEQKGVLRTILFMWCFRLAYFVGVSPKQLADHYSQIR